MREPQDNQYVCFNRDKSLFLVEVILQTKSIDTIKKIECLNNEEKIEGEASLLADAVYSLALGDRGSISAPADGRTIELSVGHAAFFVRLIDTPYMTREERGVLEEDGSEMPSVEPHEAKVGECTVSLMDCIATGQKVAANGSIVLAPCHFPKSNQ